MVKYIGDVKFGGDVVDVHRILKAKDTLKTQGATSFQVRLYEKSGGYGYTTCIQVCGYKDE